MTMTFAAIMRVPMPTLLQALGIMMIGFFSYGVGLVLFMLALRGLGASRATAFLGVAPFVGVALSLALLRDAPTITFYIARPLMVIGAFIIFSEKHAHLHMHDRLTHDHSHRHDDGHHMHDHGNGPVEASKKHVHMHEHEPLEHDHAHTPDIHHRHTHEKPQ
jgi:hypothetical protein